MGGSSWSAARWVESVSAAVAGCVEGVLAYAENDEEGFYVKVASRKEDVSAEGAGCLENIWSCAGSWVVGMLRVAG